MADLTSSSTMDDIVSAYMANSLYDVDKSTAKARLFIQACRFLLVARPESVNSDGTSTKFSQGEVRKELARAEAWLGRMSAANRRGKVRYVDTSDIRR